MTTPDPVPVAPPVMVTNEAESVDADHVQVGSVTTPMDPVPDAAGTTCAAGANVYAHAFPVTVRVTGTESGLLVAELAVMMMAAL